MSGLQDGQDRWAAGAATQRKAHEQQKRRGRAMYLAVMLVLAAWTAMFACGFSAAWSGDGPVWGLVLYGLAAVILTGVLQVRVQFRKKHVGMRQTYDGFEIFSGTTSGGRVWFNLNPGNFVGALAGLLIPGFLGPIDAAGRWIAQLVGLA